MPSFLSSLANKAQTAYEGSPLAGQVTQIQSKLQSHGGADTSAGGDAQGGLGAKSSALGNIHHQFKQLQMQYSFVAPVQRIITTQKSVSLDYLSVSKDQKSQSKEVYLWGQKEDEDIKDGAVKLLTKSILSFTRATAVSDRLAYLSFVQGSLSGVLAAELDASRLPLKTLRNAENTIEPKRSLCSNLQIQISKLENDRPKGSEKRLAELKHQLQQAEDDYLTAEKELEIIKRKAMLESERSKWAALREYGEKLVLLAEASAPIVSALPFIPPSAAQPYTGAQATAATRASLQQALDNYTPGSLSHSFQPSTADLNRSDSRSFGVTHASELSSIASSSSPATPSAAAPIQASVPDNLVASSDPIQSQRISNPSLATAPARTSPPNDNLSNPSAASPTSVAPISIPEPTVAETGVPVLASADGPGPSSGSLKDLKSDSFKSPKPLPYGANTAADLVPGYNRGVGQSSTKLESAEEEKARLQREERERVLRGFNPAQNYETAEEEKKRLEREERERLLNEQFSKQGGSSGKEDEGDGDATPPPYQEI
ncbi:hypothetical protein EW145_g3830 [Phellinidium pouzarii]|uniref:Uncharacterized protein n=1 Tax=Phellinidium pouzarii TaxID=167371 RepID=A0A4S4L7L0_9AGAM|nr:hypothetical protein EW145_g3830 [Phellinidium pouzarii]